MSPKDHKIINIAAIRAIFESSGYVRSAFTEYEDGVEPIAIGEETSKITGHCIMGALGHAFEIGNNPMWNIRDYDIFSIEDLERQMAVRHDVMDIAKIACERVNEFRKLTDVNWQDVHVTKNTSLAQAIEFIMSYNDNVAGVTFAIPMIHTHNRHDTNFNLSKNESVWLGGTRKKDCTSEGEWAGYLRTQEYCANTGIWGNMRKTTKDCSIRCATMIPTDDSNDALEDIYSLLDEVEVLQAVPVSVMA